MKRESMRSSFARFADEFGIRQTLLSERHLVEYQEAQHLVVAEVEPGGREHLLEPAAALGWQRMKAAALHDGVSLFVVSAFRSVERQAEIIRRKLSEGMTLEQVLSVCAPPGCSEHHTGRAVDVSTSGVRPLHEEFATTAAFLWLQARAGDFGFRLSYPAGNACGYDYEPWHWCHHSA